MASDDNPPEAPLALQLQQWCGFGSDIFQLNKLHLPCWGARIQITTFDSERTVIFACNAPVHHHSDTTPTRTHHYQKLDLVGALRCGLLELVDQTTQEIVHLPPEEGESVVDEPVVGCVEIPPQENPRDGQKTIALGPDHTAPIWKAVLQPNKTYSVRFSKSGGDAWCYYPDSPDRRLPVLREPGETHFTVYADPPAPTCSATLSVEPSVCHNSGSPPFKFVTTVTLDPSDAFDGPVTVDMYGTSFNSGDLNGRSRLSENYGAITSVGELVRCVDVETGVEVDFPYVNLCWFDNAHLEFPDDDFFVELWPGRPWRHEYTVELHGRSSIGGLEHLVAGKRYKAELNADVFGKWMYGRKEDLLKGTRQEKEERWESGPRGRPRILLTQVNEPVEFDVVE
ncbi:uncharacterized protein BKCO1_7500028 [Diplodia corticola]|uniref:Uncharacterized protein n=1 Tax=Diplodia corticola TaxID=236234 RepID=A0A1J9RMC9_9PEZI|nr:uncharacterized protein BKCO1_7500028 [Diplodia corticola]OJD29663.1 hypothetical protein BKCO1_7500028 [Diplodia corticola]